MGLSNYIPSSRLAQAGVCTSTTRPASPYEGQMIYETDTNRVLVYDNTAWVMIADTDQPPGLQLVKTQTIGSSVASVTVSSVFSSEFDNYKVIVSGINLTSGFPGLYFLKFNNSTGSTYSYTDNAIENVGGFSMYAYGSGVSNGILIAQAPSTGVSSMTLEIVNPFLSSRTTVSSQYSTTDIGSTSIGIDTNVASQTGFSFHGDMTGGTIRVYGYRNS